MEVRVSKRHLARKTRGQKKQKRKETSQKSFHIPFEEFPVPELDKLLRQLEMAKPENWKVDVSDSEGAQHVDCMQVLTFINIHPPEEDSSPKTMGVIYQYCASCKTAVRVL